MKVKVMLAALVAPEGGREVRGLVLMAEQIVLTACLFSLSEHFENNMLRAIGLKEENEIEISNKRNLGYKQELFWGQRKGGKEGGRKARLKYTRGELGYLVDYIY